jgi:hypothetical protein
MKLARALARLLCAMLFAAVVSLWVRTYFVSDFVLWEFDPPPPRPAMRSNVASGSSLSETLVEQIVQAGFPRRQVVTTVTGRVLVYRQSPFG